MEPASRVSIPPMPKCVYLRARGHLKPMRTNKLLAALSVSAALVVVTGAGIPAQLSELVHPSWIGKRFVRSTEVYDGSEPVVREVDVPRPYRIFTPTRSMGDMMYDPNRTNIFLDNKSVIVHVSKG